MKKVKIFFQKIKHNMPAHMQWALLGIAIVLVVMIILLLTGEDKKGQGTRGKGPAPTVAAAGATPAKKSDDNGALLLSIAPKAVDFGVVPAGQTRTEKVSVSANRPAMITDVSMEAADSFLSLRQTCTTMGQISEGLPCEITLELAPDSEMSDSRNVVNLKYYDAAAGKDMEKLETISIAYSATEDNGGNAATMAVAPMPAENIPIKDDFAAMADDAFFDDNLDIPDMLDEDEPLDLPEPVPVPAAKPKPKPAAKPRPAAGTPIADNYIPAKEECYQFAFAGYSNGGKQIGWIKPEGGHYMFHPFSDTTCDNPAGEYNSKTGFITALDNPSKKIGSDAEHIGGRGAGAGLVMPTLSNPPSRRERIVATQINDGPTGAMAGSQHVFTKPLPTSVQLPSSFNGQQAVVSSRPYDRTFVLRHFKPIPATIVNEIRAIDPRKASMIPVQATVDRHVYSDNGRTIVVPAGTLMLGNVVGDMPGPYKSIGRINIEWYRFVRPDGVEFNFTNGDKPFSGDSQGRVGVPGYGSSDYLEQMVMPLLTALVPAATNLIAPISDKIVNQIDLDNNTIVQSGTMRSSELAKQEMIKSWNKVTEKLFIDMMDNTKPPFSIAAGTRITVYSPDDLIVAWCTDGDDSTCTPIEPSKDYARAERPNYTLGQESPESMIGQVASYGTSEGSQIKDARLQQLMEGFKQYQSLGMAKNDIYRQQLEGAGGVMKNNGTVMQKGSDLYNKEYLGMKTQTVIDDEGNEHELYTNPNDIWNHTSGPKDEMPQDILLCDSGEAPDNNGCCEGETFTDMGPDGWNCCPDAGGDCFPPIQ